VGENAGVSDSITSVNVSRLFIITMCWTITSCLIILRFSTKTEFAVSFWSKTDGNQNHSVAYSDYSCVKIWVFLQQTIQWTKTKILFG